MEYEHIAPLMAFAFAMSITPGPNNLMLMASGANYGYRRSIPHMLGISIGFVVMTIAVGAGLMQIFDRYPASYTAMKILGAAYLLYLAWKIANASAPKTAKAGAKPFTFLQAAAFQWVNPKAWAMALSSITLYASSTTLPAVIAVAVVFGLVNFPSVNLWAILGTQLQRVLTNQQRLRAFNWLMAALLVGSLALVLV